MVCLDKVVFKEYLKSLLVLKSDVIYFLNVNDHLYLFTENNHKKIKIKTNVFFCDKSFMVNTDMISITLKDDIIIHNDYIIINGIMVTKQATNKKINTKDFFDKKENYKIKSKKLYQYFKKLNCFTSKKYDHLNGVFLDVENNVINFVAADGFKLLHITNDKFNYNDFNTFINKDNFNILKKLFSINKDKDIKIFIENNKMYFIITNDLFNNSYIYYVIDINYDTDFPNYKQIIKVKMNTFINFNKSDLLNNIKLDRLFIKIIDNNCFLFTYSKNNFNGKQLIKIFSINSKYNYFQLFDNKLLNTIIKNIDNKSFKLYHVLELNRMIKIKENEYNYYLMPVRMDNEMLKAENIDFIENTVSDYSSFNYKKGVK